MFVSFFIFYDAPTPPAGLLDDFTAIPAVSSDLATRSLNELVSGLFGPSFAPR